MRCHNPAGEYASIQGELNSYSHLPANSCPGRNEAMDPADAQPLLARQERMIQPAHDVGFASSHGDLRKKERNE
jgi:hypothetical protein